MLLRPELIHRKATDIVRGCGTRDTVRIAKEYHNGHIRGAVNVPYEKFEEMQTYDFPKGKILVLYCDRGGASLQAARILARNGYKTKTVIGGMKEYRGRNLICDI